MSSGIRSIGLRDEDGVQVYGFGSTDEAIDFIREQDLSAQIMLPLDGVWLSRDEALIFCDDVKGYEDSGDEVRVAVKEA